MRKNLIHVLDQLGVYASYAGMILPPWNLFWWALGGLFWTVAKVRDPSGDMGLALVFLPGIMASLPFHFAGKLLEKV